MADKVHRLTDRKLEKMERHLSAIYSKAEKNIGKEWKEYISDSNKKIDLLQKEYDEAKKSGNKDEIKQSGKKLSRAKKNQTIMNDRYKALTKKVAQELANVNQTALAYINGNLPEIYSMNYNALEAQVKNIKGFSFVMTNPEMIRNLAIENKSLLPYKELNIAKDIRWSIKKMNAQVLQGIIIGEPMDKIAKRLESVTDMSKSSAIRNARTMVTSAENKGRIDSYFQAEKDGLILQKEWISSNQPKRTREWHLPHSFESLVVDIHKPFVNGMGEIMYPADPNAQPANVYNCRCSLGAKIIGFKKVKK